MVKRAAIALVWFYTGWYAGAAILHFLGLTPMLGPVVGVVAALVTVLNPNGLIWKSAAIAEPAPAVASTASTQPG
jgi:hypothetical protein